MAPWNQAFTTWTDFLFFFTCSWHSLRSPQHGFAFLKTTEDWVHYRMHLKQTVIEQIADTITKTDWWYVLPKNGISKEWQISTISWSDHQSKDSGPIFVDFQSNRSILPSFATIYRSHIRLLSRYISDKCRKPSIYIFSAYLPRDTRCKIWEIWMESSKSALPNDCASTLMY